MLLESGRKGPGMLLSLVGLGSADTGKGLPHREQKEQWGRRIMVA